MPKLTILIGLLLACNILPPVYNHAKTNNNLASVYYNQYEENHTSHTNSLTHIIQQTPITYSLIGITFITSIIAFSQSDLPNNKYVLKPKTVYNNPKKNWYTCITNGFMHFDGYHLLGNMQGLQTMGTHIEQTYLQYWGTYKGSLLYLALYITSILGSSIGSVMLHKSEDSISIGASGALSGLEGATLSLHPYTKVYGIPNYLYIPLHEFLVSYLLLNKLLGISIDHFAHFFGALTGFLFNTILLFIHHVATTQAKLPNHTFSCHEKSYINHPI